MKGPTWFELAVKGLNRLEEDPRTVLLQIVFAPIWVPVIAMVFPEVFKSGVKSFLNQIVTTGQSNELR